MVEHISRSIIYTGMQVHMIDLPIERGRERERERERGGGGERERKRGERRGGDLD